MALPPVPTISAGEDVAFLVATVGALQMSTAAASATGLYQNEPFGPERLVLGTVKLEVEGGWVLYRLPAELGAWALERVHRALEGDNELPGWFKVVETPEGFTVHLSSLRQ